MYSFPLDRNNSNIAMVIESVCINYIQNTLLPHTMSEASRNAHLLIKRVRFPGCETNSQLKLFALLAESINFNHTDLWINLNRFCSSISL